MGSGSGTGQAGNDWDHGLLGCCKSPKRPTRLGKVDAFMYCSHSSPLVYPFYFYEAKYVINMGFQARHWEMFAQLACVHVVQVSNWQMKWRNGLEMVWDD